jgi:hypothetical protein
MQSIPSIVKQPNGATPFNIDSLVMYLASEADEIPRWGTNLVLRDRKLREFYKEVPLLSGVIYGTAARYASYEYTLSGPPRQVNIVQRMLHGCEHGRGWLQLMIPFIKDMFTQDNGAFMEIVRTDDSETAPVIQLNHLDAARCVRTGRWDTPVIYTDLNSEQHLLKWYQVISYTEYPSPDERLRGYQECAVSRLLREAQKARDIGIYEHEKIAGRQQHQIHLVGGVPQQRIDGMVTLAQNKNDNMGLLRYSAPVVIASIDQTARVSHEEINLAGMPDGYDKETEMRWWVITIADALGIDSQDVAPLHGGNLGSSQQSAILAQKGRGKGPLLFTTGIEHIFNFHGILPQTVQFRYTEQDMTEHEQLTQLQWRRMQMYRLAAGQGTSPQILPPEIIRQLMRDNGDLREEYLTALNEENLTPDTTLSDDTKPQPTPTAPIPQINVMPQTQPRTIRKEVQYDKNGKIIGVIEYTDVD